MRYGCVGDVRVLSGTAFRCSEESSTLPRGLCKSRVISVGQSSSCCLGFTIFSPSYFPLLSPEASPSLHCYIRGAESGNFIFTTVCNRKGCVYSFRSGPPRRISRDGAVTMIIILDNKLRIRGFQTPLCRISLVGGGLFLEAFVNADIIHRTITIIKEKKNVRVAYRFSSIRRVIT